MAMNDIIPEFVGVSATLMPEHVYRISEEYDNSCRKRVCCHMAAATMPTASQALKMLKPTMMQLAWHVESGTPIRGETNAGVLQVEPPFNSAQIVVLYLVISSPIPTQNAK